jgi:SAM-dependent methyltransferase
MNGGAFTSQAERTRDVVGTFGSGNFEPYDNALRRGSGMLRLHESTAGIKHADARPERIDVERFLAPADEGDLEAIAHIDGPVLDVGCGPGRIMRAAIGSGHLALGIDVSPVAVEIARDQGLPVLLRSVFDPLPAEGTWATVLLFDGNIGIGGDPSALLERCAQLVLDKSRGRILVETHPDPEYDTTISGIIVDEFDRESLPFPWAGVGAVALRSYASAAGLVLVREWVCHERVFAEYIRP